MSDLIEQLALATTKRGNFGDTLRNLVKDVAFHMNSVDPALIFRTLERVVVVVVECLPCIDEDVEDVVVVVVIVIIGPAAGGGTER